MKMFLSVWDEHKNVSAGGIRGYQPNWDSATAIVKDRVRTATAALIHFDGDVADTVRWMGGPHVGAHRNVTETLSYLCGKVDEITYTALEASWRHGVPKLCNAEASEENFRAYLAYGNHASVNEEPELTKKLC